MDLKQKDLDDYKNCPSIDESFIFLSISWLLPQGGRHFRSHVPKIVERGKRSRPAPREQVAQYDAGCKAVYKLRIRQMDAVFVEFMEEKQAQANAEKLNGYWYYNWLIDDVVGEPILEGIIKKAYDDTENQGQKH